MIASLRGTLTERASGTCVVEAAGVGYLVHVSAHTASSLPAAGDPVFLRTRQVVREDAVMLFGFGDPEELRLFDLLIGVNGVGPKLALAVLSGLRPAALARAIRDEHVAALVAIPGIGRKTAQRVVLELKEKLAGADAPPAAAATSLLAREALVELGWSLLDAERALAGIDESLPVEEQVRTALRQAA